MHRVLKKLEKIKINLIYMYVHVGVSFAHEAAVTYHPSNLHLGKIKFQQAIHKADLANL